ncbi:MAG: hypothetical protein R2742_07695 [Micropruina glycogenica]
MDGLFVAGQVDGEGVDAGGEAVRFGAGDPVMVVSVGRRRHPAMVLIWARVIPLRASMSRFVTTQQRGERVLGSGPVASHTVAGGEQDLQRGAGVAGAPVGESFAVPG